MIMSKKSIIKIKLLLSALMIKFGSLSKFIIELVYMLLHVLVIIKKCIHAKAYSYNSIKSAIKRQKEVFAFSDMKEFAKWTIETLS